jgi:hypothetical protein
VPLIVQDRFEGPAVGQPPDVRWTVAAASGGGSVTVETDPAAGASRGKVLRLVEGVGVGADSTHSEAKLALPGSAGRDRLTLVFEAYAGQSSKKLYIGVVAAGTPYYLMALFSDTSVRYRSGAPLTFSALPTATTYTAFSWERYRLVLDRTVTGGELVRVSRNDSDRNSSSLNVPDITDPIEAVIFATDDTEDGSTFYVNDVCVLEKTSILCGVARDHQKALLASARVALIRQNTNAVASSQLTDAHGRYSFSVDSGVYYDLAAYNPALGSYGAAFAPHLFAA